MTDGRRQSLEYGNPDVGWFRKRRGGGLLFLRAVALGLSEGNSSARPFS
jgi:hypothetical protein